VEPVTLLAARLPRRAARRHPRPGRRPPLPVERLHPPGEPRVCDGDRGWRRCCAAATTGGASGSTAASSRCRSSRGSRASRRRPTTCRGCRSALGEAPLRLARPAFPFEELIAPVESGSASCPWSRRPSSRPSRDYLVRAHWALYCDNYLEGFHIPFVHAGLAEVARLRRATAPSSSAGRTSRSGVARGGEDVFDLPASSPDHGQRIAAYYFWLFPNTMMNVYPWGISVNVVQPLAPDRTKVSFLAYVWDPAAGPPGRLGARPGGAGGRGGRRGGAAGRALAALPPGPLLAHPRAGGPPLPSAARLPFGDPLALPQHRADAIGQSFIESHGYLRI
jgi:hypothetical protein